MRQPPGKEIYRKGTISVYEVDGKDHKVRYAVEFFSLSLVWSLLNKHKHKGGQIYWFLMHSIVLTMKQA